MGQGRAQFLQEVRREHGADGQIEITYDRAARALERIGDPHTATIARTNAGTALMDAGEADAAVPTIDAALAIARELGLADDEISALRADGVI